MKRRVGCIVVKDRAIIATGYNGTPRGLPNCSDDGCPRCNGGTSCGERLDLCYCLHAEENALLEAGRGISSRVYIMVARVCGGELYCTSCPCLGCAKKIIQVGIKRVLYMEEYRMDEMVGRLFESAGVELGRYSGVAGSVGGGKESVGSELKDLSLSCSI
jgi:dCMP deaminase